jgi:hypothetical protein
MPSPKMVKITSDHTGPFGAQVASTAGETYTFKFGLSDTVDFDVVMYDKDSRHTNLNAVATLKNSEDKGGYTLYEYEVVVPDTYNKSAVTIGLKFKGNAPYECYFFDASCYKTSDASKTELLANGTFISGYLNTWTWKYHNFGSTDNKTEDTFTEDNKETTVKVIEFNESLMPTDYSKKMLKINSAGHKGVFGTQIDSVAGESYTFKFGISNGVDFDVVMFDKDARYQNLNATATLKNSEDKGGYTLYEYEVVVPTSYTKSIVIIGLYFNETTNFECYFFDASCYKTSDASKTELILNGNFAEGYLNGWLWKYTTFGSTTNLTEKTFTEDSKQITVKVVYFDEALMPDTSPKMLYFKTNNKGPINQRIEVKAGATYVLTFSVSNNVENISVGAFDNDSRHEQLETKNKFISGVDKGRYSVLTYEITMPEVIKDKNGNDAKYVFVGVLFGGALPVEGYFFDASLKLKGNNTELYKNGDFLCGYLDYWAWRWNCDFSSESKHGATKGTFKNSDGDVYLEVVKRDESVMENVSAVLPDPSHKMIYFKNGALTQIFSAWVDSKPGKKFILSYSVYATDELYPSLNENGLRGKVDGGLEKISEVKHDNYTTFTYRLTVPETYTDDLIFLGLNMPMYAEGYLFDLACYAEDDKKESAWKNGDFMFGFNDWIWGWTVTWFSKEGNQLREWSDGMNEIKLIPYDLANIDALIAEITRDDGEWWKPSDIIEEKEDKGVANVNGTFKDQNGTPVPNVKLILKSFEKTYTAVTDENGAFSFKNIVADFYELYYVNSEGEEVMTDFASTLQNGDTAKLTIVTDTTELSKVVVSGLKGTVYTPQLKVVSNLKVMLRGFGEVKTDKDGNFTFSEVPVGKYELYTVLEDGSEYVFREVEIKENVDLAVKLKYDPQVETQSDDEATESFNWIWIVIACGVVVILAAGATIFVVLKKKSKK